MAEAVETPEVETPEVPAEVPADDGMFQFTSTPPAAATEAPKEVEAVDEPEPEPKEEEKKPETTQEKAPSHSREVLEVAADRYHLSAEEVADMTPAQLSRTMAYLERQTQKVWEAATKTQPKPEPKAEVKAEPEVEYDFVTNPLGLDDAVVKTLQKGANAAKEARELRERLDRLEQTAQKSTVETVHKRIEGLIAEAGIADKFGRTTKAGEDAFTELLLMMGGVQRTAAAVGKQLTEPEIFTRALGAMGISKADQKKLEKEVALEERKKEFDEGALAKPGTRKVAKDVHAVVREILQKQKAPVAREQARPVEWL